MTMGTSSRPATTIVEVNRLVEPEMLVELEVVAVVSEEPGMDR